GRHSIYPDFRRLLPQLAAAVLVTHNLFYHIPFGWLAKHQTQTLQTIRLHGHDCQTFGDQILTKCLGTPFKQTFERFIDLDLQEQMQPSLQVQTQMNFVARWHGQNQAGNHHRSDNAMLPQELPTHTISFTSADYFVSSRST